MGVMVTAVCPDLFQRTALVDFSIPGDVEMIADVTESPVKDMILTASLRRKGLSFRRGTAMNDIRVMVRIRLHTALYSDQTSDSGGNGDNHFDDEAPYGAGRR